MEKGRKEGALKLVTTAILFVSIFMAAGQAAVLVNEENAQREEGFCVVIDAGHGGLQLRSRS